MRTSAIAVIPLAVLALLAGCGDGDDEDPAPEPTPGATATASATPGGAGAVASCLVGEWRSTGVGEQAGSDAATFTLDGGADIALSIGDTGATTIDFSTMAPIDFTGEVVGTEAAGSLSYAGQGSATMRTDSDAESGRWEPTETDWSGVRVTLDITEPVAGRPLDDTPIGEGVEELDQLTGEVVDVDPVLGEGDYQCQGDNLVVDGADAAGITWTFSRA